MGKKTTSLILQRKTEIRAVSCYSDPGFYASTAIVIAEEKLLPLKLQDPQVFPPQEDELFPKPEVWSYVTETNTLFTKK